MKRRQDIDQIRGLAILLMVMVHAAATWAPPTASTTSLFAIIIAGLGGLAAPLFVTVGGWVTVQSSWSMRKAMIRFAFLMLAQVLVNVCAPHLFDPFTPGVLSLFAILYLLAPLWLNLANNVAVWGASLTLIVVANWVFLPGDSTLVWDDRINAIALGQIIGHFVYSGTYPVFPWIFFSILGAGINIHAPSMQKTCLVIATGMIVCIAFLLSSIENGIPFAQPTGSATLTFFPANAPFLIGACTGVLVLWVLLEKRKPFKGLNQLGRLSLTLYIVHFIPLYFGSTLALSWHSAIPIVVLFTMLWWPITVYHQTRFPTYSLEYALQRISRHEEERAP